MPEATPRVLSDPQHRPAGIVTRVGAMGVDIAMVVVLGSLIYLACAGARLIWSPTSFNWPTPPFAVIVTTQLALAVIYLTASWAMTGRTYGSSLLGLRVLTFRRRIPGWSLAFVRAVFCVFFPIGLFWVVLSPARRSLQDVVLRTVVVYDWHKSPA
ncbi:MAG: RDD family protein [Nakamurella sp.]